MYKLVVYFLIGISIIACNSAPKQIKSDQPLVADSAKIIGEKIDKELIALNEKVNTSPGNPSSFNERASYFVKHQKLDAAYEDLIKGFSLDSTFMPLYNTLADFHLMKSEPAQAKAALDKALTINKKSYMTHVKLGELYYIVKKYDLAFKSINAGLKINKYYADGYFWKGMIYKEKGDTTLAESNFQTAIEQDPENYKAYMQLGLISLAKLSSNAIDYFGSAIKVDPSKSEAYYGRAYYYQLKEDYDKSIQDYTKVVELSPKNANAYYNLGIVQYALRVIPIAFTNFNKAIELNPKYAEAFYMRGLCNEAKGNDDAAIADYEFALSLKDNYQLASLGLERVNKIKKALKK